MNNFSFDLFFLGNGFFITSDYFEELLNYDRFIFQFGRFFLFRKGTCDFITSAEFVCNYQNYLRINQSEILPIIYLNKNGILKINELIKFQIEL